MNDSGPDALSFRCRSCLRQDTIPVLSLGSTPLANSLLSDKQHGQSEHSYPLDLVLCRHCTLLQITESVSPETLFEDYLYFSSFSETMLQHSRVIAERLINERSLSSSSLIVEIASNDGYLLQNYRVHGIPVLGIEPARNIAQFANTEKQIPTLPEFFTQELASRLVLQNRRADVIHANNVLAHVPDLNGFVAGIRLLLKDDGIAVIEVPYAMDLIDHCEFDTIYHEHLSYFFLHALDRLFATHGLFLEHAERLSIHGGSLRLFAGVRSSRSASRPSVETLLADELRWGVNRPERYDRFRGRVTEIIDTLRRTLTELKAAGKSIAIYGASAKGSTLLNCLRMPEGTFEFVVDRSTVKQGRFTPGTLLPIYSPEKLRERRPDYALLLTWNFSEEILEQQAEYRKRGGRFIIPLPVVRVV